MEPIIFMLFVSTTQSLLEVLQAAKIYCPSGVAWMVRAPVPTLQFVHLSAATTALRFEAFRACASSTKVRQGMRCTYPFALMLR